MVTGRMRGPTGNSFSGRFRIQNKDGVLGTEAVRKRDRSPSRHAQGGQLHGSNRDPLTLTSHVVYAASRISSNLKGSTKQFGRLQAFATSHVRF
jgi:hypothetical protein